MKTAPTILAILAMLSPALFAANPALDLAKHPLDKAPKGFTPKVSGAGKAGKVLVREGKIPALQGAGQVQGRLLEVTGGAADDKHYTLVMLDAKAPDDFTCSVRFRITGGQVMRVVGIAFRAQDADNYYLLGVKPADTRLYWSIFEKGKAIQGLKDNQIQPAPGGWHDLKFSMKRTTVNWTLNGKTQYATYDPAHTPDFKKGQLALWVRADTRAEFAHLKLLTPAEARVERHVDLLRAAARDQKRVLALQLVARTAPNKPLRVLASLNPADIGQAAHADCDRAMKEKKDFHGRANGIAVVTVPLKDKDARIIGAVRVRLRTDLNSERRTDIARAKAVVNRIQEKFPEAKLLFE